VIHRELAHQRAVFQQRLERVARAGRAGDGPGGDRTGDDGGGEGRAAPHRPALEVPEAVAEQDRPGEVVADHVDARRLAPHPGQGGAPRWNLAVRVGGGDRDDRLDRGRPARGLHAAAHRADLVELGLTVAFETGRPEACRYARRAARPAALAAAAALLADTAGRLDALLLRPLSEVDDRPLVVVPTGPLHSLPWSQLPSCAGRPVTVAPSATLWHRARAHPPARGPVAAIAGPRLPAAGPEG
jgi:hypothetical protein